MKQAIYTVIAIVLLSVVLPAQARPSASTADSAQGVTFGAKNVEFVAGTEWSDFINTVAARGSYVYLGNGPELNVLDISNPAAPVRVGSIFLPDIIEDIALDGNYAYLTDWGRLHIIDISTPSEPSQAGYFEPTRIDSPSSHQAAKIAVEGNHAYLADTLYPIQNSSETYLKIIDVSIPTTPVETGVITFTDELQAIYLGIDDLVLAGNYAYVSLTGYTPSDNIHGIFVVDISDPYHPTMVNPPITQCSKHFAVGDDYLYAPDCDHTLKIYDMSQPISPTLVSTYTQWIDPGANLVFDSGHLYIEGANGTHYGTQILDVSDPLQPLEVGFLPMVWGDFMVSDGFLSIATGYDYQIADVTDPTNPVIIGEFDPIGLSGYIDHIIYHNDYVYVRTQLEEQIGWTIVNVTDPSAPGIIGPVPIYGYSVAKSENYLYGIGESGMAVMDVTNPISPTQIGFLPITATIDVYYPSIAVNGNCAYVGLPSDYSTDTPARVLTIDISTPTHPTLLSTWEGAMSDAFLSLIVSDHYLNVINISWTETRGVLIFDISNPVSPVFTGHAKWWFPSDIAISNGYAYMLETENLQVLDVSNPANPHLVGTLKLGNDGATDLVLSGQFIFIAGRGAGLLVASISDPIHPELIGWFDTPGSAEAIDLNNNLIYLADYFNL